MAANPILWFQKQRVHAPIVRQPVAKLLPTIKQIERMRKTEKEARNQYFLAVYIVILAVTTLLGTAVMVVGPKCRQWWRSCWRSHMYERLRVSFRESRREVYSRVSPEDEGDDQGDEECPESCERAVHVTTQRLWTAGAFACTAIACTATCIYSLQSDRLDKNSGLDWELYVGLMLGGRFQNFRFFLLGFSRAFIQYCFPSSQAGHRR